MKVFCVQQNMAPKCDVITILLCALEDHRCVKRQAMQNAIPSKLFSKVLVEALFIYIYIYVHTILMFINIAYYA